MKNLNRCMLMASVMIAFIAISSFSQTKKVTETSKIKPAKMEKTKVPVVVTETFVKEYPMTTYDNWYGYPLFADESDWYGYNPYYYNYESPEYYVVEFENEKVPYKAIYNKEGKRVATHRVMKTAMPAAITTAMNKGEYKGWKMINEKEEIFKDTDKDEMKVYKIEVEKGKDKHILFYLSDGKLLKDKSIKI